MGLFSLAAELEASQLAGLAIVLYQTWVKYNHTELSHAVYFNLGASLSTANELPAAAEAYQESIRLAPQFVYPRVNLGLVHERMQRPDLAILEWKAVEHNIKIDESNKTLVLSAINHLGRLFESSKQLYDALASLTKSLELEPNQPDAIHHWVSLRQKMCLWPVYSEFVGIDDAYLRAATSALAMISITDDPQEQLDAARNFVRKKIPGGMPALANPAGYQHKKIRIGYCSSDFSLHPVSMLTVQMLELHDRDRFEIYGYCWSPEDGSEMRARVINAIDHFERINHLSDAEAAELIRRDEIDILIDLQGQTAGARAEILAYRPAPIQITYLGLPATTGFPFIDYVIADRFLIPQDMARFYSEQPLYMPDIYQVSDRKRISGAIPKRADCGLPATGFVFCSFNMCSKITPETFDVWMRILQRVPDSVLWLVADNQWAEKNLRREALARGIGPERIIFAARVSPQDYLARFAIADLFLDTFPFNAGTTANDALWMGLPVLTRTGRSFSSRMAGALLTAAKMDELITYNWADYEAKAVSIASNPDTRHAYRTHLAKVREHGALFDTPLFVRNLEERLEKLAIRSQ
jgi:predicted O-linked N-acetylglucosamine transferase (SPINDLY family)